MSASSSSSSSSSSSPSLQSAGGFVELVAADDVEAIECEGVGEGAGEAVGVLVADSDNMDGERSAASSTAGAALLLVLLLFR